MEVGRYVAFRTFSRQGEAKGKADSANCRWERTNSTSTGTAQKSWSKLLSALEGPICRPGLRWDTLREMITRQFSDFLLAHARNTSDWCSRRYFSKKSRLARLPVHGILMNIMQHSYQSTTTLVKIREDSNFTFGWYDSLLSADGQYFEKLLLLFIASYFPENELHVLNEEGVDLALLAYVLDDDVGFVFKAMRIRAVMGERDNFRHLNLSQRLDLIPFCLVSNAKEEEIQLEIQKKKVQSGLASAPPQEELCSVCLANPARLLTIPCGHLATCRVCCHHNTSTTIA